MSQPADTSVWWLSAALMWLAGAAVGLAIAGPSSLPWLYLLPPTVLLVAAWAASLGGAGRPHGAVRPRWMPLLFAAADVGVSASPLGGGLATGLIAGGAWAVPAELLLLSVLRGLGFGLLVRPSARPEIAAALASFVLVVASGQVADGWRTALLVAGAGLGAATLALYHRACRRRIAAACGGHAASGSRCAGRWSIGLTVGGAVLAGLVSGALIEGDQAASRGLWAVLPTSGGSSVGSERASLGVGDGPDEAAGGRDPRGTGFDVSDVFVNSDDAGLYDAFVEAFGEPVRRTEQLRLIGLRQDQIITSDRHATRDLRSGRSLALRRTPRGPAPGDGSAREAGAVLLVRGPAPMRLRLAVYDVYDPLEHAWQETPPPKHNAALYPDTPAKGWMQLVDAPTSPLLGRLVSHEIRLGELVTEVLPMPELVTAFKLGRVDRPDFFAGSAEHLFRLFRRRMPAGAVLEVTSRPAVLEGPALAADPPVRLAPESQLLTPAVASLVSSWRAGREVGWDEVLAATEAIRRAARHATAEAAGSPTGVGASPESIEAFLLQRRVGAATEFATTAAVVLRSMGYATRLAGGFYVRPQRLDRRSGLIHVLPGDAHVWPEVRTASGLWIPLEPTPGFETASGRRTWWQHAEQLAVSMGGFVARHSHALGVLAVMVVVAVWQRKRLLSALATTGWWLSRRADERERVRRTLRLLRRRCELACGSGRGVPGPWLTPREFVRWARADAVGLEKLADWACYAPAETPPPPGLDVERSCRWAAGRLNFRHFRTLLAARPPVGPDHATGPDAATAVSARRDAADRSGGPVACKETA